jgi:hypothetical protein
LVYLEISKTLDSELKSNIDKLLNPHLRLYRYNHKIKYHETDLFKVNNLNWKDFTNIEAKAFKDVLGEPSFQYWTS